MEVQLKEPHGEGGENEKVGGETAISDWKFRKPSSSDKKDSSNEPQEDQLEFTRAKMSEVIEENERLKTGLAQIVKDYQSLQMQLFDITQKQQDHREQANDSHAEEPELVELSLGTSPSTEIKNKDKVTKEDRDQMRSEGLTLGLEYCYVENSSCDNCSSGKEEAMDQAVEERWAASKLLKSNLRGEDDEVAAPQANVKRARVSVRARCDAPTMNDGCQWRKYGQKVSKGNPCPKAYYRCTVATGCPVRKQVQRCIEDMSILITTYEGTHSHPLPASAAAMAAATSAAACILNSGPSPPQPTIGVGSSLSSTSTSTSTITNLENFNSSHPNQFYISNQYMPSPSSHPTITLDLTPSYSLSSSTTSNAYIKNQHMYPPSSRQGHWQRAASSALGYDPPPLQRNLSTDTIAKVIASDPGFQSVLAAAITSHVGARGAQGSSLSGWSLQEGCEAMMKLGSEASLSSWAKNIASAFPTDDGKENE